MLMAPQRAEIKEKKLWQNQQTEWVKRMKEKEEKERRKETRKVGKKEGKKPTDRSLISDEWGLLI